MSYCRWSSDNWKSDVYIYESQEGFVVHVADNRIVGKIPTLPSILKTPEKTYLKRYKAQMDFLGKAKHKKIGGIYDGQIFKYHSLEALLKALEDIKEQGYRVPKSAIEIIKAEMKEQKHG